MALLFMEGFENYSTVTELYQDPRFFSDFNGGDPVFESGRVSGQSLRFDNDGESVGCYLPQDSTATIYGGFGFKYVQTNIVQIISFSDSSNGEIFDIEFVVSGPTVTLAIKNGATTLAETSPLSASTWYHIGFKVLMSDTVGTAAIYVDGVLDDSNTGLDTSANGSTAVNRFAFHGGVNHDINFDDVYIGDDSGSDMTDIVGDLFIEQLVPDGVGSSTQFTPSVGSNYQNVDDTTPDDDTTYNESSTSGHKDLFTAANLSQPVNTVYAVQISSKFNKQQAGTRTFRNKVLSNVTEGNGATVGMRYQSYSYKTDLFENDPDTSSAWTESGVNAMEVGYEVVS